jgi:18S rRNA (guanine1575-N7)-methyltransferase
MITNSAMRNGFTGGMIVDYPNSKKKKKYYLFLMAGYSEEIAQEAKSVIMPKAKTEDDSDNDSETSEKEEKISMFGKKSKVIHKKKYHSANGMVKSKSWILAKKERQRKQGKDVKTDSKYTGRKRPARF